MATLTRALDELRTERKKAQHRVEKLDEAITVIDGLLVARNGDRSGSARPKRTISAAARRRISLAQKARWARVRQKAKAA